MLKLWIPAIGLFHLASIYARSGNIKKAIIPIIFALIWFFVFGPVIDFIKYLGVDSFSEARNFDFVEAYFWLTTVLDTISVQWSTLLLGSGVGFAYISLWYWAWRGSKGRSKWVSRTRQVSEFIFIFTLIIIFPALVIHRSVNRFLESSDLYETVRSNFTHSYEHMDVKNLSKDVSVFFYIGESTSSLNMGLYGYPRATTPLMSAFKNNNPNFMLSKNVWSTHAHTSPSLLEALSIAAEDEGVMRPTSIFKRKRVPLTGILNEAGIKTHLFSNQGASGTYNLASSIIFPNAERTFSNDKAFSYGNRIDKLDDKPLDHEVLQDMIHKRLGRGDSDEGGFYVFHSYSGHGPYKQFMPREYHKKIDGYYSDLSNDVVFGGAGLKVSRIEAYDSIISYIDSNITQALEYVKNQSSPMIFVYISDHGEAPFAGRGHDSSRFILEMLRVPLIVYFNDAAVKKAPDLFQVTKKRFEANQFASLGQLSDTLLEFFGVEVGNRPDGSSYAPCPIGAEACAPSTLMVREFDTKTGFVRTQVGQSFGEGFADLTDEPTEHNILHRHFKNKGIGVCYGETNSLAKAFRGTLSTDCLEFDVILDQTGAAIVDSHDGSTPANEASSNNLLLTKLVSVASEAQHMTFFMNAKFETVESCHLLQNHLSDDLGETAEILINFPSPIFESVEEFDGCLKAFHEGGAIMSYKVPTQASTQCAQNLKSGAVFSESSDCLQLNSALDHMASTSKFTDISFEANVYEAVKNSPAAQAFRWNVQHIEAAEVLSLQTERLRLVVPKNSDLNTRP